MLELTIEDIYFITGISHRGIPVNLNGIGRGGDPMSMQDYIDTYCLPGTQKLGTCVPISRTTSFPMKVMVSTIARVPGSSTLHLATRTQMRVVLECM